MEMEMEFLTQVRPSAEASFLGHPPQGHRIYCGELQLVWRLACLALSTSHGGEMEKCYSERQR